jgi:hypothetical protein
MFNITDAPGAIGSSEPPLLERFPGLVRCCPPPNSNDGTDIAIPEALDFWFFKGDVFGVVLGVDCFGDFDPKFQNE